MRWSKPVHPGLFLGNLSQMLWLGCWIALVHAGSLHINSSNDVEVRIGIIFDRVMVRILGVYHAYSVLWN